MNSTNVYPEKSKQEPYTQTTDKQVIMKWVMATTLFGLSASLFLLSGIIYLQIEYLTTPLRQTVAGTPPDFQQPYQDITITAQDGVDISAWYIDGVRDEAIILVHGTHANRQGMLTEARLLAEAGYQLLLLDLRGHGNSGDARLTYGYNESLDVLAAVDYLTQRPHVSQIGVLGHSLGGAAVARAAATDTRLQAVIIQSTYSDLSRGIDDAFDKLSLLPRWPFQPLLIPLAEWRTQASVSEVSSMDSLRQISPRPVLIIHGTEDGMFPIIHAEVMYAAANHPKEFWQVEGLGHVNVSLVDPDGFRERVLPFLEAAFTDNSR